MHHSLRNAVAPLLAVGLLGGCAHAAGPFTWVQDYTAPVAAPASARIAPGDLLAVKVWKNDQMGGQQRVHADGTVSLFFAPDLRVAGLTTTQAADSLAARLNGVLVAPQVNVVIEEVAGSPVTVSGEVTHPGRFAIREVPTLLAAITVASGLTEFAHRDRIYVLRAGATTTRIRFTWQQISRGEDLGHGFRLAPGDIVVVE